MSTAAACETRAEQISFTATKRCRIISARTEELEKAIMNIRIKKISINRCLYFIDQNNRKFSCNSNLGSHSFFGNDCSLSCWLDLVGCTFFKKTSTCFSAQHEVRPSIMFVMKENIICNNDALCHQGFGFSHQSGKLFVLSV